jgi:hypothetical protein
MGKHQIRRLPIIENGLLVGIVSLGDIALRSKRKPQVAESLEKISEPPMVHRMRAIGKGRALAGLMFAVMVGAMIAVVLSSKSGGQLADQLQASVNQLQESVNQLQSSRTFNQVMDRLKEGRERFSAFSG